METTMPTRRRLIAAALAAAPLGAVLAGAPGARADDLSAARAMIQSTGDKMVAIIDSSAGYAQKQAAFQQLVYANVDVDGVARFVLGRFWRVATPAQQRAYMETFRQLLVYAVTGQTSSFQGATFTVGEAMQQPVGLVVTTTVNVPGKPPANVQWVVAMMDGQPKIIDILAEGTSLRLTERNDYAGVISQHGGDVQPLIDAMRNQLARFQSGPTG
jgi:phospholipid transport system substrate-binding protein